MYLLALLGIPVPYVVHMYLISVIGENEAVSVLGKMEKEAHIGN